MGRLKELADHQVYSTEDYRRYTRRLDRTLVEFITEVEARTGELAGLMIGMNRFCQRKHLEHEGNAHWRAFVALAGLRTLALNLRAGRWACKKLFGTFESKFVIELESIRQYHRDRRAAQEAAKKKGAA